MYIHTYRNYLRSTEVNSKYVFIYSEILRLYTCYIYVEFTHAYFVELLYLNKMGKFSNNRTFNFLY